MDSAIAIELGREAVMLLLKLSLPLMMVALVVGLAISLFQALTQIQEMTLSFVPKIIAIFLTLLFIMPYIGSEMAAFSERLAGLIVSGG